MSEYQDKVFKSIREAFTKKEKEKKKKKKEAKDKDLKTELGDRFSKLMSKVKR